MLWRVFDASGKATQARLLAEHLRAQGREAKTLSFPNYETLTGRLIGMLLRGERVLAREAYGALREADEGAVVLQALMTVNRLEAVGVLRGHERRCEFPARLEPVLVLDRYWLSAVAYGVAAGLNREWLLKVHEDFPVARTIWVDVPVGVSVARRAARDRHEADLGLLERARVEYARLADEGYCLRVDGVGAVEEVAERARVVVGFDQKAVA